MISYVPHGESAEYGIAESVYRHIGVAVSEESELVRHLYPAQPEIAPRHKPVDIITLSYSVHISYNHF